MNAKVVASIACAALSCVATAAIGAAIQRTFVASNGADANPCTIAQPCRSFGAAIGKTVPGGEVIALDSAAYGIVTIAQSVSIVAPPGVYAGISVPAGQTGVAVNGAGIIVALRGLTINGIGAGSLGVRFLQGARLRIENCVLAKLASTAIGHHANAAEMIVADTTVRDNDGAGIVLDVDATMLLDGVRVEHNAGDGVVVLSGPVGAKATIRNSVLAYNDQAGVAAFMASGTATTRVVVENSMLSQNGGDGAFVGGTGDGQVLGVLSRNVIERNALSGISAFNLDAGGVSSVDAFGNTFSGNGNHGVTVQGFPSQVFMDQNYFAVDEASLLKVSGGFLGSFGNNSGFGGGSVTPAPPF
jgi:Right handed beta helix region